MDISTMQPQNGNEPAVSATDPPSVEKIQQLLKVKDDTSRFVGLALLKSVLDNSPDLQKNEEVINSLWTSISPKFLDRLLRTGSVPGPEQKNSRDMLDLAVAVLHTFTVLLPDDAKRDDRLLGRIPRLTRAVLHSSTETSQVIIETLLTLVTIPEGAKAFARLEVDDWTSLIEMAPEQAHVLSIFIWAWVKGTVDVEDGQSKAVLRNKIDQGTQSFVSSFIGTDATSLLEFTSQVLRNLDADLIPQDPKWLGTLTKLIRNLATNRPTAASRSAYTNCAGALLLLYPHSIPQLLFVDEQGSSQPFSYLFVNLILVDIRATMPSLLEKLNDPDYPQISQRLASALDILTAFIGQLVAWVEALDDADTTSNAASSWIKISPDFVLKLSKSIAETLSVTMEYLRDRWDASVAGAHGLHQQARSGNAHTASGSHKTLAWDAKDDNAATDAFTLSAIRAMALWLRDDDGDALRKEGAGLMDMFMELYQTSSQPPPSTDVNQLDFRLPILAALEGILETSNGIEAFISNEGWKILSQDLLGILDASSSLTTSLEEADALRGTRIAIVLQIVAESEGSTQEDRMGIVTAVAAYDVPTEEGVVRDESLMDFQASVLQLASMLLANASAGMKRRYVHSASAIRGIADQLRDQTDKDGMTAKELDEVSTTLKGMSV